MKYIKNTISFKKQIITLYLGVFLILISSYIVISKSNKKINVQKDKINQVESIKFALYELNFKINQKEISKIDLKLAVDSIDRDFHNLLDKSCPLYSLTITDSTNRANLLLHLSDEEKCFYDALKNWRLFAHIFDKNYIRNNIYDRSQTITNTITNDDINKTLTFTRQVISSKLSYIRRTNLIEYHRMTAVNTYYVIIIGLINVLYILYMYYYSRKMIISPLHNLVLESTNILNGKSAKLKTQTSNKEINVISSTINNLITENQDATNYIKDITSRDRHQLLDYQDKYSTSNLFISIKEMQSELNAIAKQEKERKWIIEGQAIISEILNRYSNNFDQLTKEIIQHLVKYTGSLQGGLFTLKKDKNQIPLHLELVASYAYDRIKYLNKKIKKGEGILGQVWIENKGVYLENIPENHMEIKSHTGNTSPKCILVETLIDNKEFFGVIELASIRPLKDYERKFISKIAENIAATLAAVENNNRTYKLLEESQHMTVKLQKQEEETKRNLHKLKASQEEINRREIQKENELKAFREDFNDELKNYRLLDSKKEIQIKELKTSLLNAETDNEAIRELKAKIEIIQIDNQKKVLDLEETIKIKEIRLNKYRRKIDRLESSSKTE
jgi:hypothetical protein